MMWKRYRLLLTPLFFGIGLIIGTGLILSYEATTFHPWTWGVNDPPIIANCYGEDFNELYIKRAVKYWETKAGEKIGFIEQDPPTSVCKHDGMLDGWIILRKAPGIGHDGTLASTTRKTVLGKIRAAEIRFSPGSFKLEMIIEHELGHAFGYQHVDAKGHIMYPTYDHMGKKFWIP